MTTLAINGGERVRHTPFPKRVPFGEREEELLLQAVRSQNLFGKSGTFVKEFEQQVAAFYGTNYAQSSTSGTAAIHTAIGAVNPEPGDEIITAPITDPGSVMPILMQNAVNQQQNLHFQKQKYFFFYFVHLKVDYRYH